MKNDGRPFHPMDLAPFIDHTLLSPVAGLARVDAICDEARRFGFAAVCVHPCHVPRVRRKLEGSGVKTCTVAGFPLGANVTGVKVFEASCAAGEGAEEIDMVMNLGAAKAGQWDEVGEDIRAVVEAVSPLCAVKVILESCYLTDHEIFQASLTAWRAGARFVKTSTGFGPSGATEAAVRIMTAAAGRHMGVKAAGGIRDTQTALRMIEAGATRVGSSCSLQIIGVAEPE